MQPGRSCRPHLHPQGCLLDYTIRDVLDATTPEELHIASYGCWLGELFKSPAWGTCLSKTLLATTREDLDLGPRLWPSKAPKLQARAYARILQDQRVVQRAQALLIGDLPLRVAINLSLEGACSPVLFADGVGAWRAIGIPALGPTFNVDLLNPMEVSRALRNYLFEYRIPPATDVTPATYGWNPIPEFKRLFEITP